MHGETTNASGSGLPQAASLASPLISRLPGCRAARRYARRRTRSVLPRAQVASLRGRCANPPALLLQVTIGKEQAVSAQGVHKRSHEYAVVWRTGDGPTSSGRLELGDDDLVLHGSGGPDGLRIPFDELSSVEIGRGAGERINGDKSLVLERPSCERVLVAALGGVGLLGELTDLLARRRAERAARASVAVVVPIRRGTAEAARRLVEEGPPFDVERLDRKSTRL